MSERLSKKRRALRVVSYETAAQMIREYHTGGADEEDLGLTNRELVMLIEENERLAALLDDMAEKIRGNE